MHRLVFRSFVNAQALVGIVLSVSWLVGNLDLQTAAIPLYTVAALLLMYSLLPTQWSRSPDRLAATLSMDATAHRLAEQFQPSPTLRKLASFAAQHKFSIQLALTSGFLCAAALLLQVISPAPGV
jgi:hypothetical protein